MTSALMGPEGVIEAECECGWTYDRSLEADDELTVDDNREIAERVVRSHRYKCNATGEDWGETEDGRLSMPRSE
ncbi:hypothetical protein [Natrinema hispanicum]|nr:hypothetical protein [Natrinema hispanicum]